MFITFEGLDFCGKSTQAALLARRLREPGPVPDLPPPSVILLRDPGGTPISERVRDILLDRASAEMGEISELMLFSASRAQLVAEIIRPALSRGEIVLCDRFYDSTTAYQGFGRGVSLETIRQVNAIAADGAEPDLTILVDVGIEEIERRRATAGQSSDRMESAGRAFYERVRAGYLELARAEQRRVVRIDGMGPIEQVHAGIWDEVSRRMITDHKHSA